jgi:beta-N-acetylhexosaminidase
MIEFSTNPYNFTEEDVRWVIGTKANMDVEGKIAQLFCLLSNIADTKKAQEIPKIIKPGGMLFYPAPGAAVQNAVWFMQDNSPLPMLIAANLERGGNGIASDGAYFPSS